jgi:hypothetical protein
MKSIGILGMKATRKTIILGKICFICFQGIRNSKLIYISFLKQKGIDNYLFKKEYFFFKQKGKYIK